jgi:hypothetical protein
MAMLRERHVGVIDLGRAGRSHGGSGLTRRACSGAWYFLLGGEKPGSGDAEVRCGEIITFPPRSAATE